MDDKDLIFIVDDSEIYTQLLSGRLEKKYKVMSFESGRKVLDNIHLQPKAIILDYYMDSENKAARNGVEIFKEIKEQGYDIPVIFVSIAEKPEIKSEIDKLGAYGFVSKEDDELIEKIEDHLNEIIGEK